MANRYYEHPDDNGYIADGVDAMRHLGNLYMTRAYDYKRAYDNLSMARQLAEEHNLRHILPYVNIGLANLWQMNTHINSHSREQVHGYVHDALVAAIREREEDALPVIVVNFTTIRMNKGSWGEYTQDIAAFKKYRFRTRPDLLDYSRKMVEGTEAYFAHDWTGAERAFAEAAANAGGEAYAERYLFSAETALARACMASGKSKQAADILVRNAARAHEGGFQDYEMHFYGMLSNLYEQLNETDSLDKYYAKYLKLKHHITEKDNLGSVSEAEFLLQIDRINGEVRKLSVKRIEQRRNLLILSCVLVVVIILLAVAIWSFVNLRRHNRRMFEKNVELLKINDELKSLRTSASEEVIADAGNAGDISPERNGGGKDACESVADDGPDPEMRQIYERVIAVLDTSDEIYKEGFNLTRLGELVHSHYRYVSQAINKCSGSNFNQLLITYRIQEACRRMHSSNYANYTIEAIAESVGFRSRTSFSALFKKKTGLTPAEYFRLACEESC